MTITLGTELWSTDEFGVDEPLDGNSLRGYPEPPWQRVLDATNRSWLDARNWLMTWPAGRYGLTTMSVPASVTARTLWRFRGHTTTGLDTLYVGIAAVSTGATMTLFRDGVAVSSAIALPGTLSTVWAQRDAGAEGDHLWELKITTTGGSATTIHAVWVGWYGFS